MNKHSKNALLGIILISLGILFLLDAFDVINFWKAIWPIALIIIGLALIFKRKKDHSRGKPFDSIGASQSGIPGLLGDIRIAGLTEGVGTIDRSLLLGDIVIDLAGSKLLEGDNIVNASVLLGDVNIFVPDEFPVKVDLSCVAGSVSYNKKSSDGILPGIKHSHDNFENFPARLYIKGKTCFGDVRVISISK
jgi:predicted membrane protein